ncbi:hypothetical protein BLNAU_12451 [Blattamonas nauphoetae]|uniref:Protein kinase domain-containing protein n=1 Tax=Blattamonas nauphoetae TaxID=2049346 RepID=A0ABQ9XMR4_9EUKA|nr:hypothetical protein BLNAU_12451 [Blattamonas nauphoetae]
MGEKLCLPRVLSPSDLFPSIRGKKDEEGYPFFHLLIKGLDFCNQRYNDRYIDIWSCGVTLFSLVCGFLPSRTGTRRPFIKRSSTPDTRYTAAQIRQHPLYLDNFVGQSIIELVVQEGSEKGEVVIDTEVTVDLAAIPT